MTGKRKILFVSSSLLRGGTQRVISILSEHYAKRGWEVHIIVLYREGLGYAMDDSIIVHDAVRKGNQIRNAAKWITDIRNVIREIEPNVIVSFAGRINMLTMLASRGTGIPVLVSERNDPVHDRRSALEQWLCKRFYKRAEKVIFQTQYQAEYYRKYCENSSVVIGNPISAPAYEGEHRKKDIVCVGKLMDQKNHPMMIKAFKQIAAEFPDKKVFIYGEGAKRAELEALVKAEGLEGRIHFPGNSDHIFDVMHEYEYFVMCSDYEGLSNALLEAMISGMVCVTTAWNGVEEVVTDGVNGYLVPVGDENALAHKLRKVLTADNEEIRRCGIETGKRFGSETVMTQWCSTIEKMVK